MAILGISGSPKKGGNVDRMVQSVLEQSGKEAEFVNLSGLKFDPCRGCVQLCTPERICQIKDGLYEWLRKVRDAEVLVLGTPYMLGMPTGFMFNFMTRLEGFHHVMPALHHKPALLVSAGCKKIEDQVSQGMQWFERLARHVDRMKLLGHIYYNSQSPPCLRCGEGQHCKIGGLFKYVFEYDEEKLDSTIVNMDLLKNWEDSPETVAEIEKWGKVLREM